MRELRYPNGIVIIPDRGLDIYKAPDASGVRYCRSCPLLYFELDCGTICKEENVAATVAHSARTLLTDGVTADILKVEALMKDTGTKGAAAKQAKQAKLALEETKVQQFIADAGFSFTEDCRQVARADGFCDPAEDFVVNYNIYDEAEVQDVIKEFVSFRWLAPSSPLYDFDDY